MNLKLALNLFAFINIKPNKYLYTVLGRTNYVLLRRPSIKNNYNNQTQSEIPKVIKLAKATSLLSLSNNAYMLTDKLNENFNDFDYKKNIKLCNPSYYTYQYIPTGDNWSYSTLIHKIKDRVIDGVSINLEGTRLIAIDNNYISNNIHSINLHIINSSPLYLEKLIDLMIKYNIQFDFIQ